MINIIYYDTGKNVIKNIEVDQLKDWCLTSDSEAMVVGDFNGDSLTDHGCEWIYSNCFFL